MKVFVTGASGFVGGHVVEGLARAGHEIAGMARSDKSAKIVEGFGGRAVRCELGAVEVEHLRGQDAIVHCAAFVEEWGTREQFWEANVEGTTQLLHVAKKAGVSRFVHIGTEAALFDGHDLLGVDETHPYPDKQRFLYSETKAEAERRVLAANGPGFTTISLRPRLVWGPRDASVLPAIVKMAEAGKFRWLDGGHAKTSTTHVKNLVRAVELALEKGRGGESYFVADAGEREMREFLIPLAKTRGADLGDGNVPGAIARPLAAALEGAWRLFRIRRPPPMTHFAVAMMSRSVTVRTDKAARELGYAPVIDVAGGLAELGSDQRS
jgi:nucleoside-diphosphate-sugar epimerase